ncbi:glycine amidinotransferase [Ensifer sp. YR511]|nr:glycine amidinotransferase [Ensifer sp. YR511]
MQEISYISTRSDQRGGPGRTIETAPTTSPAASSYNEWDPLEEVIIGVIDDAVVPAWNVEVEATMPAKNRAFFVEQAGQYFPSDHVRAARDELESFAEIIASRGIKVRRPALLDYRQPFSTPNWSSKGGLYGAMPRDVLLVVGDLIIESPMAWRSRYFEADAYREHLVDYFKSGSRWISAPKPQLKDDGYRADYDPETPWETKRYVTAEAEPLFDAADFIRCGRDIFAQRSHVTNELGIDWVSRHVGNEHKVHVVDVTDSSPMHIDATFMPLAPGKLLVNRKRVGTIPPQFSSWDIRFAPEPTIPDDHLLYMSSAWLTMNVFMLNPNTVVVEAEEWPLVRLFEEWGFDVVRVPFRNVMRFGGCFHCVTADTRREGSLQAYF